MSGKYCEVPDNQQQTPHIIRTSEIEETSRVKQTPKGGIKRLLTPSPVLKCDSRQLSSDLSEVSERLNMDENLDNQEAADTEVTEGVSVAVTMGETDIKRVAKELQQLILPDISQLIVGQIPDIQSIVDGAIKSAVSQINSTLLKEINSVKRENTELKQTDIHCSTLTISSVSLHFYRCLCSWSAEVKIACQSD